MNVTPRRVLRWVVPLAVLAGLAAFAALELARDRREGRRAVHDLVFPHAAASVADVTMDLGGRRAAYRRGPGGWTLVEGPAGADAAYVTDTLGAWSRVRLLEVVDEAPRREDLARYGLAAPGLVLRARLAPAEPGAPPPESRFELGGMGPLFPSCYARLDGHARVVLVSPDALDLSKGIGRRLVGLVPEEPPDRRHQ